MVDAHTRDVRQRNINARLERQPPQDGQCARRYLDVAVAVQSRILAGNGGCDGGGKRIQYPGAHCDVPGARLVLRRRQKGGGFLVDAAVTGTWMAE